MYVVRLNRFILCLLGSIWADLFLEVSVHPSHLTLPFPHPKLVMNLLCTVLVHHKSTVVSGIKGPIMTGVLELIQSPLLQGTAPLIQQCRGQHQGCCWLCCTVPNFDAKIVPHHNVGMCMYCMYVCEHDGQHVVLRRSSALSTCQHDVYVSYAIWQGKCRYVRSSEIPKQH